MEYRLHHERLRMQLSQSQANCYPGLISFSADELGKYEANYFDDKNSIVNYFKIKVGTLPVYDDEDIPRLSKIAIAHLSRSNPNLYLGSRLKVQLIFYSYLLDPAVNVNESHIEEGRCCLFIHQFARYGTVKHLKVSIERGAEVDKAEFSTGLTALMIACQYGDYNMVKLLLDSGADPLKADSNNRTSLSFAFNAGTEEILEIILDKILCRGLDCVSAVKYIKDTDKDVTKIIAKTKEKYMLILMKRWLENKAGRTDDSRSMILFLVEKIVPAFSKLEIQKTLCHANIADRYNIVWLLLRAVIRLKKQTAYLRNIERAFLNAVNHGCSMKILRLYASMICDKDRYIKIYRSCNPSQFHWESCDEHDAVLCNLKKANIKEWVRVIGMDSMKIKICLGGITDIGIPHHFQWFLSEYSYSALLVHKYKGLHGLSIAMKHPHLWKYFYYDCVKDPILQEQEWQSLLKEAYAFSEWYHTTPRSDTAFLSVCKWDSLKKNTRYQAGSQITNTLQKPYLCECLAAGALSEMANISHTILTCLEQISAQLKDRKFSFIPILSGSSAEGTKTGYPDEFDYLLQMDKMHEKSKNWCIKQSSSLTIKDSDTTRDGINPTMTEFIIRLDKLLKEYKFPQQVCLISSIRDQFQVRPLTFALRWYGDYFKELYITVDLVPAFPISFDKAKTIITKLQPYANKQLFIIPKASGLVDEHLRLSYSMCELDILNSLPRYLKEGYRLAKAMRHHQICPAVGTATGQYVTATEYINSYMLKTCLFHTLSDLSNQQNLGTEHGILCYLSISCALKIYQQLKILLEIHDGQVPSYFVFDHDITSGILLPVKDGELKERVKWKKSKITLFFIDTIIHYLKDSIKPTCSCCD